jgi:uncharacterized protein (TIGR00661 family)
LINEKKINNISANKRILVAPLDWGLGHATRCIPIIKELISQNFEVVIAAGGASFFLLKKEFTSIIILRTYSYKIRYSRKKMFLSFSLLLQAPAIFFSILKDHFWLKKIVIKYHIDAVISDNRFGLYHKKIHSVYITHQLLIKTGKNFTEKILQKLHYYFIKKFNSCWIPDYEENGLAGDLSHQQNAPSNVSFIGALSRFEKKENVPKIYDILISLSGPEPQRTIFEKIILEQLKTCDKKILFVRGLPGDENQIKQNQEQTKIVNHLSAEELNMAFLQSKIIISRSGYTTIMDLIKVDKNAVLVPTPGQTEQEYLAIYLMYKKYFYSVRQNQFSLADILNSVKNFSFTNAVYEMNNYKKGVNELLISLNKRNFPNQ